MKLLSGRRQDLADVVDVLSALSDGQIADCRGLLGRAMPDELARFDDLVREAQKG